jgi:coproporphyrinogen III oxidase
MNREFECGGKRVRGRGVTDRPSPGSNLYPMQNYPAGPRSMAARMHAMVKDVQLQIARAVETVDESACFRMHEWEREEGGGGLTMVLEDGRVFEKAGVNTSAVYGIMPEDVAKMLGAKSAPFFATGVSLVIHARSPLVPTVHANFRYFALGDDLDSPDDFWFGGGADLTPVYPFVADARHFHHAWKSVCDEHRFADYQAFKTRCDEYFYLPHRCETRGVGGIFYDYFRGDPEALFDFSEAAARRFVDAYLPVVERRIRHQYDEDQVVFQEIRRGRYAEFNLLFDRGTRFGIQTGGRTESILMSMPPRARWVYDHRPEPGSREADALQFFRPFDWLNESADIKSPVYERTGDTEALW